MLQWPNKAPGETLDYAINWANELGGDTITNHSFVVTEGNVAINSSNVVGNKTVAILSGGTEGTHCLITASIETSGGDTLSQCIKISITECGDCLITTTTKRQLVEQMFIECRLAGWEYDITSDEKNVALTRVDAMMRELLGRGLDLQYNFPLGIGQSDLDDPLGCPDQAFYGLSVLGAQRLCPTMGKTMTAESKMALNDAMKAVRSACQLAPTMRLAPSTPRGSGNRFWGWSLSPFVGGSRCVSPS